MSVNRLWEAKSPKMPTVHWSRRCCSCGWTVDWSRCWHYMCPPEWEWSNPSTVLVNRELGDDSGFPPIIGDVACRLSCEASDMRMLYDWWSVSQKNGGYRNSAWLVETKGCFEFELEVFVRRTSRALVAPALGEGEIGPISLSRFYCAWLSCVWCLHR